MLIRFAVNNAQQRLKSGAKTADGTDKVNNEKEATADTDAATHADTRAHTYRMQAQLLTQMQTRTRTCIPIQRKTDNHSARSTL